MSRTAKFVPASQLVPIRLWCPVCDETDAKHTFSHISTDCCEGGAIRVFECEGCGAKRERAAVFEGGDHAQ